MKKIFVVLAGLLLLTIAAGGGTIIPVKVNQMVSSETQVLAAEASSLINEGKTLLTARNLLGARDKFKQAVIEDPANQEANLLYGITRVFAVVEDGQLSSTAGLDSVREILELTGFSFTSFSVYDMNGNSPETPADTMPNTGDIILFLNNKLLPEVDGAIANMAKVTSTSFTSSISSAALDMSSGTNISVDYGDAQVLRALLYGLKCQLELLQVYGLNVHLPTLLGDDGQQLKTYQQLLQTDPTLLSPKATARLATAKTALINFIDTYSSASTLIMNRQNQEGHLFVVDEQLSDAPIEVSSDGLRDIRNSLAEIKAALNGPRYLSFVKGDERAAYVDLSKFFNSANPINIRNQLATCSPASAFPDTTFGGLFPMGLKGLETVSPETKGHLLGIVCPAYSKPMIGLSPDFVSADPDWPATLTLSNNGTAPLAISSMAMQGVSSSNFSLSAGSCGSTTPTLQPATECTMQVSFSPTSSEMKIADLAVYSNDTYASRIYTRFYGNWGGALPAMPNYTGTVNLTGTGTGIVYISDGGYCSEPSCSGSVQAGTDITLTAAPEPGSLFSGWSGCDSLDGFYGCRIVMNSAKTVTATFTTDSRPLNITASPAGGTYATPPTVGLIANKDAAIYYTLDGSTPTTSSTPYSGPIQLTGPATLKYFGQDGLGASSTVKTETYAIQNFALQVTVTGAGDGSVISYPGGISASTGTQTAQFQGGSWITLYAAPNSNSLFSGWSQACNGTDIYCTVLLDENTSVTATFNLLSLVRILGSITVYYGSIQEACNAVTSSGTVQVRNYQFSEYLDLTNQASVYFKGGYNESFGSISGMTDLTGVLTIRHGSLTVENLAIR